MTKKSEPTEAAVPARIVRRMPAEFFDSLVPDDSLIAILVGPLDVVQVRADVWDRLSHYHQTQVLTMDKPMIWRRDLQHSNYLNAPAQPVFS